MCKIVLNDSDKRYKDITKNIAAQLKSVLGNLYGYFIDTGKRLIDYKAMKRSMNYIVYKDLSKKLSGFDPSTLKTDNEKKAFWINIYNGLIIHGVIELDIKDSVKEVLNFSARIGYNIGGAFISANDIEHGILRGHTPDTCRKSGPLSFFKKRPKLGVERFDSRIHFALVCASNSSPPVEFYDSDKIDEQLDAAARSFIRREGLSIDRKESVIYLLQIFKWYARDFGLNTDELLRYIFRYADESDREYYQKNRASLSIKYQPYNWNLNK
ncbi:DUF547 domain-containing protein [Candidatus Omnitrophota bacterium]